MSEGHANWKARAAECKRQAQEAMETSAGGTTETKAELLKLAAELLRLAEDIEQHLTSLETWPEPDQSHSRALGQG